MATLDNVYAFLRNGGSSAANVNGAITPVDFTWTADRKTELHRMLILVQDNGQLTADNYGAVSGASVTNGVGIKVTLESEDFDLTDSTPVTSNGAWARLCYDMTEHSFGSGDNFITARWTFARAGRPIVLASLDSITVTINDDLTGLTGHTFMVQGTYSL